MDRTGTATERPLCDAEARARAPRLSVQREARLLGLLVAFAGALNIGSALTPAMMDRFRAARDLFTPGVTALADGAAALLGVTLLLLGRGISRRRRAAHHLAIGLLLGSTAAHLVKGFDVEEATFTAALAGMLIWRRRGFTVNPGGEHFRSLLRTVPALVVIDFGYGIAGLYIRHHQVRPTVTISLAAREVADRLVGGTGPLTVTEHFGRWFPQSITVLAGLNLLVLLAVLLAPVTRATPNADDERERVRRLVDRPDGDTLDPFALRHDKHYVFSADERAVVGYRYVNGVGLAAGDPVGETPSFPDAVARFLNVCDDNGWRPAIVGGREDRLPIYEGLGLRGFYLGDEAIVDVADFSLTGRRMRPVRQAVSRTNNFGVSTEFHLEGDLDPTLRRALQGISERARAGAPERGFSMALDALLSGRDRDCVVVVCRDRDGAPIAFQRYVPCKAGRGLSLDAMRRDRESPNGVNERMIADAVGWAAEHGVAEVSLNFAAFRGLIEDGADLGPVQAAEAWLVRRLNPYFQIETLYRFNAKFHPRWVRRYLVYRSPGDLLPVAVAGLSAEAFLPFDKRAEAAVASSAADGRGDDPAEAAPATTEAPEPAHT